MTGIFTAPLNLLSGGIDRNPETGYHSLGVFQTVVPGHHSARGEGRNPVAPGGHGPVSAKTAQRGHVFNHKDQECDLNRQPVYEF